MTPVCSSAELSPRRAVLLLLVAAGFVVLAGSGCGKDEPLFRTGPADTGALDASHTQLPVGLRTERIRLSTSSSMRTVVARIPSTLQLLALDVQLDDERFAVMALSPPTSNPTAILAQFAHAAPKGLALLDDILGSGLSSTSPEYNELVRRERETIAQLRDAGRAANDLVIRGVVVRGMSNELDALRAQLETGN